MFEVTKKIFNMIIILIDKNYETYRNSQTLNLPIPNCLSTLMVSQKSPKAHLSQPRL